MLGLSVLDVRAAREQNLPAVATNIYLPGAGGNQAFWSLVAERRPGGGQQRLLAWPDGEAKPGKPQIRDLDDLATHVGQYLDEPANVIAQSMGGVVAVKAAVRHQLTVRRLVLVATSGGLDMQALGARDWRQTFESDRPRPPRWFEAPVADLTDTFQDLGMPTLLIWGQNDELSPPAVGERLAELIPNAQLVILDGAGHDLAKTHHEQVAQLIDDHIASTPLDSIYNATYVTKNIASSGRIPPEALPSIAEKGYHTLINLLPSNSDFHVSEEPAIVRRLGLDYQQIEVDFDAPKVADFELFVQFMAPRHDEKVWVHCAANYRVSTFLAAYLERHEGWSPERAARLRERLWEPNDVWVTFAKELNQD